MAAKKGFGTTFTYNGATVAKLTSIGGVEITRESYDATTHQSTGGAREFLPGLYDAGEVAIVGLLDYTDTAGQIAMAADSVADPAVLRTCVITPPAATGLSWTFEAFISKFKLLDGPMDGLMPFTASVKISGVPVLATAVSTGLTTTFFAISGSAVVLPAPATATLDYAATVLTAVASVTVTPIAAAGVITVNGNVVASGAASSAITLGAAGSLNKIVIVVTEANKAPKTYTIWLTRA